MHISDGLRALGIYRKAVIVVVLLPFLLIALHCVEATPEKNRAVLSDISFCNPVLVAGEFCHIDITLTTEHEKICIIAFNGAIEPLPHDRSQNNYYRWEYANGNWSDLSGYDSLFIDPLKCSIRNTTYSFYIKISNKVTPGSWTIKVLVDSKEISSTSLQVIIGNLCLFFSTIVGAFEHSIKQKELFFDEQTRCCVKEKKLKVSEETIEKLVDHVLERQSTEPKEKDSWTACHDIISLQDKSLCSEEPLRSATAQYHRSKLREITYKKTWGKDNGFYGKKSESPKRFFIIVLLFLLVSTSLLPLVALTGKNLDSNEIIIINIQSYPIVGGKWSVLFTTKGQADLTISAVNGTTWSDTDQNQDLKFLHCLKGDETLKYQWINNSVFIPDFSSNITCSEVSEVLTAGIHTLKFQFGNDVVYAHNLAFENWLQTSTDDFNNGTKTNINVSNGSFHLQETFYLRNFSLIDDEGFEGSWPPSGWSESPAGSNWNAENYEQYEGSFSADFDGVGGSGGASGNLLSPSMNCSGSNVTAIYVKFWAFEDSADDGEYYLDYYDGTSWDEITRLDNFGSGGWAQYSQKLTDSQYFKTNFQIRWRVVGLNNNEHVYVDLVNVTVERNESGYYTTGALISQAHDTTRNAPDYSTIFVSNITPSSTTITTWVRSAETEVDLSSATWFSTLFELSDQRWIQWRINLTGNSYTTATVHEVNLTWIYDNEDPISSVTSLFPYWQTTSSFEVFASALDNGTGIKEVALFYNYSANNNSGWTGWTLYGTNDTTSPYNWSFNSPQGDGYYRFYSRTTDRELNIEDPPNSPGYDTFCGVDTVKPTSQLEDIAPYWYNEPDRDVIINCSTASDSGSGLKNIALYYRYRFDNDSEWGSWLYFESDETLPWSWFFNFPKAKGVYQFYSIAIDNAGNTEDPPTSPDNDTECGYNTTKPYSEVDDISPYWHGSSPLIITGQATDFNGSGLHNVTLYYYYSLDNNSWSSQNRFGTHSDPWNSISWSFTFPNGSGYYRFFSVAIDNDSSVEYYTGNDTACGYDIVKPSSTVDVITPYWYGPTGNPLLITVTTVSDQFSGIKNITLYYRWRANNLSGWNSWGSFETDDDSPWSWSFNFPSGAGHYQFYSRGYDQVGNLEDSPSSPEYDAQGGYDTSKPSSKVDDISPYNITMSPFILTATASDDTNNVTLWYYYSSTNSSWWHPSWLYRKRLTISGKNGGYQMKIVIGNTSGGNLTCNGHAQSDFDDIRFVSYSDNTTQLSYWLRNYTVDTQGTFWFNNSLNDTYIWMYYGNSNASTTGNGTNTFYFFDDFSNGLSKWTMDSWNTDSIYINQSQGNSAPALRHNPDSSIPANRTYYDTRIRTSSYRMQTGTLEYDVHLAGTPRIIHQFGWRMNALSWTNGYAWRLQTANGDGGFFEFSAPTTWTSIGTTFPDASVNTWYHVQVNISGSNYAAIVNPSCGGATTRSVSDSTKLTADYLISHVHGVSLGTTSYVLVDNVFVRKYQATPPVWGSFGSEETGYIEWINISNPDSDSPWNWNFNFPNGYGYYWFFSIAIDTDGNQEDKPNSFDATCRYASPAAPVINSYDLRNSSGSKLNNVTGLLDVDSEYYFTINVTSTYGWIFLDYIDIKAWYDQGTESSTYNQTLGGNLNMFLRYENVSGVANFLLLWPDDEVQLISSNCTQTIIDTYTRIITISFKPLSQTRWACSNQTWNLTQNITNDPFSWNFNITATDASGLTSWVNDEYGVYKFATILPDQNWVDVEAPPGFTASSNVVNVTYSSNYDFNISVYFEENLTNVTSGEIIPIANNVYICADADLTDDITTDIMFNGIGQLYAVDIINSSGVFHKNNSSQYVQVQFNVYIPFGTIHGEYSAHVATKIKQKEE
ncbi:MAG: DUF2341 domain-containing protein [Candidatus Thermoplasmatota archaeon]|nr:DUF2341 domain-containing protein [Candidatus Thermoplasmatota archaeon]